LWRPWSWAAFSSTGDALTVEVCDDGSGFPADNIFGRGLTGMHERVRALSGSLSLLRADKRTYVRCRLPLGEVRNESISG
jgi:two-component system sensor histidine kinase UhpB